ncbi:MAG: methionyl-tRNA formyltransferase [Chlamydiae bacterium]|nr:methionyl-tRNA formyltransferase [Chlamydiota bacterium]MBI3265511.1 methionyl-tRNA formyltransferase [Chlamydiota bacterium]
MKIVFMGTPHVAALALEGVARHFPITGVVTQPDRPRGRGLHVFPSPVKEMAIRLGLAVLEPVKTRDPVFLANLKSWAPDLIVVVAYGGLLPRSVLEIPSLGCVNLHSSLLPKYRGAAPVQWAFLNVEKETGWTTFYLSEGMDSGDMILQKKMWVQPEDDAASFFERMIPSGIELLKETIQQVLNGRAPRIPQNHREATLAPKLSKADGKIDWNQSAVSLWNRVRGLLPWPVAFTSFEWKGKLHELRIFKASVETGKSPAPGKILEIRLDGFLVGTGRDALWIQEVQKEGSRRMSAEEFLRGHAIAVGTVLGK